MGGLSEDLWANVLSYMDVPTLCTVRLVCKSLKKLASQLIRILKVDCAMLQGDNPAANFQHFTAAEVHVSNVAMSTLDRISKQPLAGAVASITMLPGEAADPSQHSDQLAMLSGLPKLRSFAVSTPIFAFPDLPQTLRALILGLTEDNKDFSAITGFTQLTHLLLEYSSRSVAPLNMLSHMHQLKHLSINCVFMLWSKLAPLTNLERLDFICPQKDLLLMFCALSRPAPS